MRAALRNPAGLWFGWSGKRVRDASGALHTVRDGNMTYSTMDLSYEDFDHYYNGFANRTLWPLLHFRLDLVDYRRDTYDGYRRVNALFADKLAPLLRDDDVVWVHDYHLIPLRATLRELGVGNRIGFFLHVPMPSSDLLAAMPNHEVVFGRCRPTTSSASRPSATSIASRATCACTAAARPSRMDACVRPTARVPRGRLSRSASTRTSSHARPKPRCRAPPCSACAKAWARACSRSAWTAWIIRRACRIASAPSSASSIAIRNCTDR
jgi:hypothetical protein